MVGQLKNVYLAVVAGSVVGLSGCQTPDYASRDSATEVAVDNTVRYGSIAAAGTGGYFLGQELGGNTQSGVVGAVGAAGIAWGINKLFDWNRGKAYRAGVEDGSAKARAEILNNIWEREAVYGLSEPGTDRKAMTRRVYVPERSVNGVRMAGGYQEVRVVYP